MANELEWVYGSEVTLEGNGGSVADGAFAQANDSDLDATEGGIEHPFADVVLRCVFSTAPATNTFVYLYIRPLNIDGTNDMPVPDANYPHRYVGSFALDNVTTAQYILLPNVSIPANCSMYIENDAGQTMSSGWTLKATRKTYAPHS